MGGRTSEFIKEMRTRCGVARISEACVWASSMREMASSSGAETLIWSSGGQRCRERSGAGGLWHARDKSAMLRLRNVRDRLSMGCKS